MATRVEKCCVRSEGGLGFSLGVEVKVWSGPRSGARVRPERASNSALARRSGCSSAASYPPPRLRFRIPGVELEASALSASVVGDGEGWPADSGAASWFDVVPVGDVAIAWDAFKQPIFLRRFAEARSRHGAQGAGAELALPAKQPKQDHPHPDRPT